MGGRRGWKCCSFFCPFLEQQRQLLVSAWCLSLPKCKLWVCFLHPAPPLPLYHSCSFSTTLVHYPPTHTPLFVREAESASRHAMAAAAGELRRSFWLFTHRREERGRSREPMKLSWQVIYAPCAFLPPDGSLPPIPAGPHWRLCFFLLRSGCTGG